MYFFFFLRLNNTIDTDCKLIFSKDFMVLSCNDTRPES